MTEKKRIFIVEDEVLLATDIEQSLTDFGYDVVGCADNGEDAIKQILSLKPHFVVMDISLKGKMDGIEAALQLSKKYPVPLVFLTGLTEEATLQRAKVTQPCGYLIKPFDSDELHAAIELGLYTNTQDSKTAPQTEPIDEIEKELGIEDGDSNKKLEVLTRIELFKGISRSDMEEFASDASIRSFDGGKNIFDEGVGPEAGFIVLSGKVAITKSAVSGKELIVSLLSAGDSFGLLYLLKDFEGCCSARTQIDSRLLWIRKASFEALETRAPQLLRAMNQCLASQIVRSYELASSLAHSRVEDRIVNTILSLLPAMGRGGQSNGALARLFMTRKELADLTGTTPETAIRVTKRLERDGLLDLTRPGIIKVIDRSGLEKMIEQ